MLGLFNYKGLVPLSKDQAFRNKYITGLQRTIDTDKMLCPGTETILQRPDIMDWFQSTVKTYVFDGMQSALDELDPPSIEFFLSTPSVDTFDYSFLSKHYLVYAAVLAKHEDVEFVSSENVSYRVYIGSASSEKGSAPRVNSWQNGRMQPRYVLDSVAKDGYYIVHMGVLLATTKPTPVHHPQIRAWILLNEAFLTWTFWSIRQSGYIKQDNHYMRHMCPWDLQELEWVGLNTHSPLHEAPLNVEYTEEEMAAIVKATIERTKANKAEYYIKNKERWAFLYEIWRQTDHGKATLHKNYMKYWHEGKGRQTRAAADQKLRDMGIKRKIYDKVKEKAKRDQRTPEEVAKKAAYMKKYRSNPTVKERARELEKSEKTQAKRKAWRASDRGKAVTKAYKSRDDIKAKKRGYTRKYLESEAGKAARKATLQKYNESAKGKAARKRERESDKTKETREKNRDRNNAAKRRKRAIERGDFDQEWEMEREEESDEQYEEESEEESEEEYEEGSEEE